MEYGLDKATLRRQLRERLAAMTDVQRRAKSLVACSLVSSSPEFAAARTVMLYLSTPTEVDTSSLALRCWQAGKSVVVPKVSWDQRRMLPVEISSLQTGLTTTGHGIREPASGKPIPTEFIDMVIVPGLGFTETGHRIGRGMGFYDRFLSQPDFVGVACGLCFGEQFVDTLPMASHDVPLAMLASDRGVRRFASNCIHAQD